MCSRIIPSKRSCPDQTGWQTDQDAAQKRGRFFPRLDPPRASAASSPENPHGSAFKICCQGYWDSRGDRGSYACSTIHTIFDRHLVTRAKLDRTHGLGELDSIGKTLRL